MLLEFSMRKVYDKNLFLKKMYKKVVKYMYNFVNY